MFGFRCFGPEGARTLPVQESVLTAGRSPDNEIHLDDPDIPELALRFTLAEGGIHLAVLDPRFRPLVNGSRVENRLLRPGDRLEAGSRVLILDLLDEADSASPQPDGSRGAEDGGPGGPRRNGFRAGLARLCALVAEERDLKGLLEKLMRLLLDTLGGNEAFLFSLDEAGKPKIFVSSREGEADRLFSDTVVSRTLSSGKGLVLRNALADPAFSKAESINDLRLHSVLCCPIEAAGKVTGLIYLGSNRPAFSFDEEDLRELEVYALIAGCLINHVSFIARQGEMLAALRNDDTGGMVALCPAMRQALDEAVAVADSDLSILLQGETGTGKDVLAHFLHRRSRRRDRPFLVVNCSTLRGELLASELFGHRKGAFTGAVADQQGLFSAADGGTLFLDEIGDMELGLQAMLLRALETGMIRPVGRSEEIAVDVRIVCATHRDLEDRVAKGLFRQDLFYRVNQHAIRLPPLRERGEDILLLARHFLEKARAQYPRKAVVDFDPESLRALSAHAWPGNVRELSNAVQKAVLFASGPLARISLPGSDADWPTLDAATRRFQWDFIQKSLAHCQGDREQVAALLGIGRSTLFRHLAQGRDGKEPQGS
jgi:transcriptional regulator with GAF, ATPase, and Fis domain